MIRLASALLALCLALPLAGPAAARSPELAEEWNGAEIAWRDMRSGVYEASKSGKPVILVFHATWCTSCKRYREVFKDTRIVEAARDFVMILVDGDKDKIINGAFAPDGTYVPRTIFLSAEGDIQHQIKGRDPDHPHSLDVDSPEELLGLMRQARAELLDKGGTAPAPDQRADNR